MPGGLVALLETNAEVAAALEQSVRRGLELVSRKVAATATGDVGLRGQLLQRIRRFFRSDAEDRGFALRIGDQSPHIARATP